MAQPLTAELVRALPHDGQDRLIFDTEKGFAVRVTPSGTKIFIAQARLDGRKRRVSLGTFPEMSVKDARAKARAVLQAIRDGQDPDAEKIRLVNDRLTVAAFADRWLAERVRPHLKAPTIRDYTVLVEKFIKPRFGTRPLGALTRADVVKLHTDLADRPRRANYLVQTLSAMLSYAEEVEVRPHGTNPARRVKKYREKLRERIMEASEQTLAFQAINECERDKRLSVWACQGLRFLLLTGARPDEVRNIEWGHLLHDLMRVVLPDSKANRSRVIYCNELAWQVIATTPRFGKFVFAGRDMDTAYRNYTRAWERVRKAAGLDGIRLYDARHTFASEAAKAGHSLPMIGQLLGHSAARTTQRYVHLVGDPVSQAAQDVGARMAVAMRGNEAAAVLDLPKRKRGRR